MTSVFLARLRNSSSVVEVALILARARDVRELRAGSMRRRDEPLAPPGVLVTALSRAAMGRLVVV